MKNGREQEAAIRSESPNTDTPEAFAELENSDVDLLVEFDTPHVSLFLLCGLRLRLQDELGKDVDLIHAPICEDSIIEIRDEISLYESQRYNFI